MAIGRLGGTISYDLATLVRRTAAQPATFSDFQDRRHSLAATAAKRQAPLTRADVVRGLGSSASSLDQLLAQLASGLRLRTSYNATGSSVSFSTPARSSTVADLVATGARTARLDTTQDVNSDTSTVRRSAAALGLDTTSADRASILRSSAGLGLDLATPDASSQLLSSAALGLDTTSAARASSLTSSKTLALDTTSPERASLRQSSAQINTATTSYGSPQLSFATGTSLVTLSGVYAGTGVTAGATSLAIKIRNSSISTNIGTTASSVSFALVNQAGTVLRNYTANLAAGQQYDLGADVGLKVAFGLGSLRRNETSTATTVSTTIGTDVNPNAAFNGTPNTRPRFENDAVVGAGNFTVNGAQISVLASDSINSVLAKINASAAGVTASFANDRVTLTTNAASESDITLGTDTSGFLSAVKLTSSATQRGNVRDDLLALSKTTAFSGVTNGSFTVGGKTIAVNAATDSLKAIVSRINASGANVTASFDSATNKVTLTDQFNSEDLVSVGGDTSGFLAAAGLDPVNTQRGNLADDQQVLSKTTQFSGVASGTLKLNGASIDINRDTDTLQTILAKINASAAGVTAAYSAQGDKLSLTTNSRSEDLITIEDGTGFASAAQLSSAQTVRGNIRDDQQVLSKTTQFAGVTSGSFTVDGQSISVDAATDSLQSIIDRINGSGARVTAAFDSSADKLVLTNTFNSEDAVDVSGDTSGFLAAAKLDPANTEKGSLKDNAQALSTTALFASVGSGSFQVNGVAIQVNGATDTLDTVLARVGSSGAGVSAAYDAASDRIVFTPNVTGAALSISGDTSGFLAAAGIAEGTQATVANQDGAFNDASLNGARLELGRSVTSGSFQVNGTTIAVAANDSIRSVLQRITDSAAGVTASYDAATEKVSLVAKSAGAGSISLSGDTSGFLSAMKLDATASAIAGQNGSSPLGTRLADIAATAGVQAGTLTVNGTAIAISPQSTTLQNVLDAVNAVPDVAASIDSSTGTFSLSSRTAGGRVVLEDTSGLLTALGLTNGTGDERAVTTPILTPSRSAEFAVDPAEFAAATGRAARAFNDSIGFVRSSTDGALTQPILSGLRSSLDAAGASQFGLSLDAGGTRLVVDEAQLGAALPGNAAAINALLSPSGGVGIALQQASTLARATQTDVLSDARPDPLAQLTSSAERVLLQNRGEDTLTLLEAIPKPSKPSKAAKPAADKKPEKSGDKKPEDKPDPEQLRANLAATAKRAYDTWGTSEPSSSSAPVASIIKAVA